MSRKQQQTADYSTMSLEDLRARSAQLGAAIASIRQEQAEITRWIDLRAYEAGETPQPPAWASRPGEQAVSGGVAEGKMQ